MVTNQLDPVAQRLAAGGHDHASSVLDWLEGQQQRDAMNRQATWCSAGGWLLMTVAAIISSGVAVVMSRDVHQLFDEDLHLASGIPWSVTYLPIVLVLIATTLLIGGAIALLAGAIPGLSTTRSAIDWSTVSDAMTRLLSVGCTYPEAFRTAAQVTRTRSSRRWLDRAANRVERGEAEIDSQFPAGDSAVLELMVDSSQSEPARQWAIAADHFFEVANRRLMLLLSAAPILSTIFSGLLVWISIAATLGWMWKAVAELILSFQ